MKYPFKKNIIKNSHSKKGQTLVEFTLVLILFLGLVMLTVNAVLAFSIQQYLSYVTFMTARSYQAAGSGPTNNYDRACNSIQSMLGGITTCQGSVDAPQRFRGFKLPLATITQVSIPQPTEFKYGAGGVDGQDNTISVEFVVNLTRTPFFEFPGNFGEVTLKAESFLGREVSQSECRSYFDRFYRALIVTQAGGSLNPSIDASQLMEDNGC